MQLSHIQRKRLDDYFYCTHSKEIIQRLLKRENVLFIPRKRSMVFELRYMIKKEMKFHYEIAWQIHYSLAHFLQVVHGILNKQSER